jgi:hypothetical protein
MNKALYEELMKRAKPGELIPLVPNCCTDCLMFDHELMKKIFHNWAEGVMLKLVKLPPKEREECLKDTLDMWVTINETAQTKTIIEA